MKITMNFEGRKLVFNFDGPKSDAEKWARWLGDKHGRNVRVGSKVIKFNP